ncbi:helix-turn-helix domain-containing protein [Dorea formicigenerans]|uniref:helix-turn-helix domain-containing protein n=1 Tax=Dorea formicigenerans TaxID=39486 RepID=UPI0022E5F205|nr:helix-turn-helix transcriptional regulator [Dorea formicigenerans]
MEKLAIRLKELREERGLSQMAAGTVLGVSRSTIAGYETKGREPDAHMLITMADFYDVSMDYLVGRKDEK